MSQSPRPRPRRKPQSLPKTRQPTSQQAVQAAAATALLDLDRGEEDAIVLAQLDDGPREPGPSPTQLKARQKAAQPATGQPARMKKPSAKPSVKKTASRSAPRRAAAASTKTRTKTSARQPARVTPRTTRRNAKSNDLKAVAAPLLATVGVLLLIPAMWALLLLMGVGVPGSARDDSRPMAAVMLISWPIAICLIAASVLFFNQILREKKQQKRLY